MAKLKVSAELVAYSLFKDADKCPTIVNASWDIQNDCIMFEIIGEGVPEGDGEITATFHQRKPISVEFKSVDQDAQET